MHTGSGTPVATCFPHTYVFGDGHLGGDDGSPHVVVRAATAWGHGDVESERTGWNKLNTFISHCMYTRGRKWPQYEWTAAWQLTWWVVIPGGAIIWQRERGEGAALANRTTDQQAMSNILQMARSCQAFAALSHRRFQSHSCTKSLWDKTVERRLKWPLKMAWFKKQGWEGSNGFPVQQHAWNASDVIHYYFFTFLGLPIEDQPH